MQGKGHQDSGFTERMGAALSQRFPGHAVEVEQLVKECERFRELGNDYLECGEVLRWFEEQDHTTKQRVEEYEYMQACLEQELLESIERRAICPHCGRKHGGETTGC